MTNKSRIKKRSFFSLGGFFLVVVIAGIAYLAIAKLPKQQPLIEDMTTEWQPSQPAGPPPQTDSMADDQATPAIESLENVSNPIDLDDRPPCQIAATELDNFFKNIEGQEYVLAYELKEDVQDHLNKLTIKLLNNPPNIGNETDDLLSILKNAAHFYRLFGAKDVSLVKDIMTNESDDLESMMESLFQWHVVGESCTNTNIRLSLPLDKLYEYSCYFLNTLGGQSYLFRRESRIRILIKYYCILILDRADQAGLNHYGIDITYALESTLEDIDAVDNLQLANDYIHELQEIKTRRLAQFTSPQL